MWPAAPYRRKGAWRVYSLFSIQAMTAFTVLVMRPVWFIGQVGDYDTLADLSYVAEVTAENEFAAMRVAREEVWRADKRPLREWSRERGTSVIDRDHDLRELEPTDYTIIGVMREHGVFTPIFNEPR